MFNRLQSFRARVTVMGREVVAEYNSDPESGTLKLDGIPAEDIIDFMEHITRPAAPAGAVVIKLDGEAIAKAVEASAGAPSHVEHPAASEGAAATTPAEGDDKPKRKRRTKEEMARDAATGATQGADPRQLVAPGTEASEPATSNAAGALASPDAPLAARAPQAAAPPGKQPPPPAPDSGEDIPFGKEENDPNDPWGMSPPTPASATPPARQAPAPAEPSTVMGRMAEAVSKDIDKEASAELARAAASTTTESLGGPSSIHPGVDVNVAKEKSRLAGLLSYLIDDVGIRTVSELVSVCEALKSEVPLLSRINDLAERVPRRLAAIDVDLPTG
jgi:hypothetical protein